MQMNMMFAIARGPGGIHLREGMQNVEDGTGGIA